MTPGMPFAMPFDLVVVMDPIASIKIAKDSTFAMLLEPSGVVIDCITSSQAGCR